jgi:hypothetical protein
MHARHLIVSISFIFAACGNTPLGAPEEFSESSGDDVRSLGAVPRERDLAIAFELDDRNSPTASTLLGKTALLPTAAYSQIARAFERTSVGTALTTESQYGDWRVVSMRISPCSSLAPIPVALTTLCWPEVRLVLQPVVYNQFIRDQRFQSFADDRGIHMLYDVEPESALGSAESTRAAALLNKIRSAPQESPFAPLTSAELSQVRRASSESHCKTHRPGAELTVINNS